MKKHFLLLVMALMSMTSWATIQVKDGKTPVAATELTFNGAEQSLVKTDGEGENTEATSNTVVIYYRVTDASAGSAPTFNVSTWLRADAVKETNAGNYKVWYVAYDVDAASAGTPASLAVTIAPKSLSVVNTPITTPANGVYTGASQIAAYDKAVAISDKALGISIPASNFEISYQYCATSATGTFSPAADIKNAGFYKQTVKCKANGNYTGTLSTEAFQIAKVDLMVKVGDLNTFFNGTAPSAFTITYSGWVASEDEDDLDTKPTVTNTNKNAGTYTINAAGGVSTNYNFVYVPGKLTIAPRMVKITPVAMTATFGSEEATITSWTGKDYFSNEPTAAKQIKTNVNVQVQNGYDADNKPTYSGALTDNNNILAILDATEYKDGTNTYKYATGLTLTRPAGTEAKEYVLSASGASTNANYEIVYETSTFTIGKGAATINLYNATKAYGDEDPELVYTITGVDEATEAAIREKVSITRAEGEAVGSYDITLTVADNESFTDYTVPAKVTAKFMITKRNLKITAKPQVLFSGNTVLNLDQEAVTFATLAGEEKVAVELSFNKTVLGTGISAEDVLTDGAAATNLYAGAILVNVKAGQDAILANYNVTLVPGDLTVMRAAEVLYLDDTNESLDDAIKAANGKNRTIQFSSRTLKAGQWNTIVLPFATTVTEISTALGYAVVDVLGESTSPETISLKLAFGAIPANTPFMVQPAADKDLSAVTAFGTKTIVYSADPKADDGQGHYFKGTYKGTTVTSADKSEYYYSTSQKKFVNASGSTKIGIMRAFLKDTNAAGAGARVITIEEADGSVTAIDTVEAQNGENNGAIYNLQGVRVNKASKGVFIQNGKKVIIK